MPSLFFGRWIVYAIILSTGLMLILLQYLGLLLGFLGFTPVTPPFYRTRQSNHGAVSLKWLVLKDDISIFLEQWKTIEILNDNIFRVRRNGVYIIEAPKHTRRQIQVRSLARYMHHARVILQQNRAQWRRGRVPEYRLRDPGANPMLQCQTFSKVSHQFTQFSEWVPGYIHVWIFVRAGFAHLLQLSWVLPIDIQ